MNELVPEYLFEKEGRLFQSEGCEANVQKQKRVVDYHTHRLEHANSYLHHLQMGSIRRIYNQMRGVYQEYEMRLRFPTSPVGQLQKNLSMIQLAFH